MEHAKGELKQILEDDNYSHCLSSRTAILDTVKQIIEKNPNLNQSQENELEVYALQHLQPTRETSNCIQIHPDLSDYTNQIHIHTIGLCGKQGQGKTTLLREMLGEEFGFVPNVAGVGTREPNTYCYSSDCYFQAEFFTDDEVRIAAQLAIPDDSDLETYYDNGFLEDNGIILGPDGRIVLPDKYETYYGKSVVRVYQSPGALLVGLNMFHEQIRSIDPAGLLVKHIIVGFPAPILRWMNIIDLPGEEDTFPHRNAFLNEQIERVDTLLMFHRRTGIQITKDTMIFWNRVSKLVDPEKVRIVITNAKFSGNMTDDDEMVKNRLPRTFKDLIKTTIHVESIGPNKDITELEVFLRELLYQTNIIPMVQDIEPLLYANIGMLIQSSLAEIQIPQVELGTIQQFLSRRVECLGYTNLGATTGARDLKYAQTTNSILSGIAPKVLGCIVDLYPRTVTVHEFTFQFGSPVEYRSLQLWMTNFSKKYRDRHFFQRINSQSGTGMTKAIASYVGSEECMLTLFVNKLNDFITQAHKSFISEYNRSLVAFLKPASLSSISKAAIELFIEEVTTSVALV